MRIPLHIKVMVSYLLVVGLVFLPAFLYLRVFQRRELHQRVANELAREARALGERLSATPAAQREALVREFVTIVPQSLTVLTPTGEVLANTAPDGAVVGTRADRPEIRLALEQGTGIDVRKLPGVGEWYVFSAIRYPSEGPVLGLLRLGVSTRTLDSATTSGSRLLNQAGAVALSAAVLLSLVAAVVVSRPLRRIAESARSFAAGDFGQVVDVTANDELGDAAKALSDLASQLRGRLLASGADRAALHALLDELPVGVVIFDPNRSPVVITTRARELCELAPHHELERAQRLAELPAQAEAIRRVLSDGFAFELPLQLPWNPRPALRARWVATFAPDGSRQPALIVMGDEEERRRRTQLEALLRKSMETARSAARQATGLAASELLLLADDLEAELQPPPPSPSEVHSVRAGDLCEAIRDELMPLAETAGVELSLELEDPSVRIVEAGGRARSAIRALIGTAIRQSARGQRVRLRGELRGERVHLSVREGTQASSTRLDNLVGCLGGEAGLQRDGDGNLSWLTLPRG